MQVVYGGDDASFWNSGMTFVSAPLGKDTEITGHTVPTCGSRPRERRGRRRSIDDVAPGTAIYVGVEASCGRRCARSRTRPTKTLACRGIPGPTLRETLQPGQPVELTFDLCRCPYLFKAGHRIRFTLQFATRAPRQDGTRAPRHSH